MKARLAAIAAVAAITLVRTRLRDLGATRDEATRPLPGDEIVPHAHTWSTMAITIEAPPDAVWPWLVQMGSDRAGWYSYDRIDNGGRPSAERIEPTWQQLAAGDRLRARPGGASWFDVSRIEPERVLVLRASLRVPSARQYTPPERRPRWYVDSTWAFVLEPCETGATRVLVRIRSEASPRRPLLAAEIVLGGPAHLVMQRRQLLNLRRRAMRPGSAPRGPRDARPSARP